VFYKVSLAPMPASLFLQLPLAHTHSRAHTQLQQVAANRAARQHKDQTASAVQHGTGSVGSAHCCIDIEAAGESSKRSRDIGEGKAGRGGKRKKSTGDRKGGGEVKEGEGGVKKNKQFEFEVDDKDHCETACVSLWVCVSKGGWQGVHTCARK